jgi:hypothetical protein
MEVMSGMEGDGSIIYSDAVPVVDGQQIEIERGV